MDATPLVPARPKYLVWLALLSLAVFGWFLHENATVQPGGSDSSGYFNMARLLARGQLHTPVRPLPGLSAADLPWEACVPLGFRPDATHTQLIPTYPVGFPLLLLLSRKLAGFPLGPNLLLVLHSLAGLWLVQALARALGCSRPATGAVVLMLGLSPLYLMYSLHAMSDLPAMVWVTLAVWLIVSQPESPGRAAVAGFAFGVAVLLRPTDALALAPLAVGIGLNYRRWIFFILGGLPCAIGLLAFNQAAYGSMLSSGYPNLPRLFSFAWVPETLAHYALRLPAVATPLVLAALGLPLLWRNAPRTALLLAAWILPMLTFYAFYYHTREQWWYLRFLLPAFPGLLVAALLVIDRLIGARKAQAAWIAITALTLLSNFYWIRQWHVLAIGQEERVYQEAAEWANSQMPADAIVISMQMSGSLFYYTSHPLLRWDTLGGAWPRLKQPILRSGRPVYGLFFEFEEKPAMQDAVAGPWVKVGQNNRVGLWRFDAPATP